MEGDKNRPEHRHRNTVQKERSLDRTPEKKKERIEGEEDGMG